LAPGCKSSSWRLGPQFGRIEFQVRYLFSKKITRLIVRNVLVAELVHRFCDRGDKLCERLHLIDRSLYDRVKNALHKIGNECGKINFFHPITKSVRTLWQLSQVSGDFNRVARNLVPA